MKSPATAYLFNFINNLTGLTVSSHSTIPRRTSTIFSEPLSPAIDPQEEQAEKDRATRIHAAGVTEFVGNAGVVDVVNGNVVAHQKIWQRARHERALQHAATESGRGATPLQNC